MDHDVARTRGARGDAAARDDGAGAMTAFAWPATPDDTANLF
jgi:hypothetical protein